MPQTLKTSTGHCHPPNRKTAGRKTSACPLQVRETLTRLSRGLPMREGTAGGNPYACQGAPSLKLWGTVEGGGSLVDQ